MRGRIQRAPRPACLNAPRRAPSTGATLENGATMRLLSAIAVVALSLGACAPGATNAARPQAPPARDPALPSADAVAARELTADRQVRQALGRLTFGARPGDYERVRAMGVDRWIALQLRPERIDDAATDRLIARLPTLSMSPAALAAAYPPPQAILAARRREARAAAGGAPRAALILTASDSLALRRAREASRRVIDELQTAKVARAVASERQLEEVMVDFWENHFNVFAGKGPERYLLASYERDAIRPHALGRFRDLLGAVAKSPAMLYYLDNWESSADDVDLGRRPAARAHGLNENYGRELLELHTLGADGGYTQQDVIAAARALTGWTIRAPRQGGGFVFRPAMHDTREKVFLGHTLPAGRGIEDGEDVLDILARHPSTARFIATKLVRRFVSDTPPPALVARAAATFTRTDGDIREVLRAILTSPEFFSRAAYHAKIRSPFELVVGAARALGAEPDTEPRTARLIARLGQPLYGHRDPNGYPETGDAWINTGAILARINFGLAVAAGRLPGAPVAPWARALGLGRLPRDQQIDVVVRELLGGEASPDTRKVLRSGANPLLGDAGADSTAAGLERIVGLALGAPEFQRR